MDKIADVMLKDNFNQSFTNRTYFSQVRADEEKAPSELDISDNMSFNLEMTPTKEHEDGIVKMHDVSMFHSFNVSSKLVDKM